MSLLHFQQNVEIPETCLIIHPVIQRAVELVKKKLSLTVVSKIAYGWIHRHRLLGPAPISLISPETPHRFIFP